MTETFDAVLAEALRHFIGSGSAEFQQRNRAYFDRLAAAHAREVIGLHAILQSERDALKVAEARAEAAG